MKRQFFTSMLNVLKYMPYLICIKWRRFCCRRILNHMGKGSVICDAVTILNPSCVSIGDFISIHEYTTIGGAGNFTIGNSVAIASHCRIISDSHIFSNKNQLIKKRGVVPRPVVIEDDVWIGAHPTVQGGIKIERGAVVGAGSVVTQNIPAYAIAFGVPCEVKKFRPGGG